MGARPVAVLRGAVPSLYGSGSGYWDGYGYGYGDIAKAGAVVAAAGEPAKGGEEKAS